MELTLSQINAAVDAAFQTALAQTSPVRVSAVQISDNATLRTDVYYGANGGGFVVVATVDLRFRQLVISKQHGPETWRDRPAPELTSLLGECRNARAARYSAEASVFDLADAETKMTSSDPYVRAEGTQQKLAVFSKRLEIKNDLPKPR